jgi:hypothetical protein
MVSDSLHMLTRQSIDDVAKAAAAGSRGHCHLDLVKNSGLRHLR